MSIHDEVFKIAMTTQRREVLLIGGKNDPDMASFAAQLNAAGVETTRVLNAAGAKECLTHARFSLAVVAVETAPEPMELIRELTFLFRGLPVLAAAAKGSVSEAREIIAVGAADYLLLPLDDVKISSLIQHFADQYFDPELGRGRRLITSDTGMQQLLQQIRRVARSMATVLIQGESGTGKELIARFVHQVSDRHKGPFIAINCAALPENLLESELFGHAKGAFTGALADRKGKFQQANGGAIFLDEISEMSLNLQAKLLRVLQEREVDPVGGRSAIPLDVRVIASTNRDLKSWAQSGKFREDLYYRLNVFPVKLPPLRQRPNDIGLLAEHFRKRFVEELGRNAIYFSKEAVVALNQYSWPGNVRELENVIHRALLVADGGEITVGDLMIDIIPTAVRTHSMDEDGMDDEYDEDDGSIVDIVRPELENNDQIRLPVGTTVRQMEEFLIHRTLDEVKGNRTRAAELLGISIRTLRNKLNEYAAR
ncbi:MAG: sigma-54-dependent Fis family transcriptional regulator [Magnetococcales bacterium]|nr:sigma-54-dependent Fis family transcriptional regulator [Magnetococcales bacterium]MBF0438056.1 sigma-54-dependent Fis family transcriptional regulator [Magnetococcales bacterium]